MVLLLNYLPWIIIAIGGFFIYKFAMKKQVKAVTISVISTIVSLVVLQGLTAGYIPKVRSSDTKIGAPAFEVSEAEIKNIQRRPARLGEDSEARFNEKTDWRKHMADRAAAKQLPAPAATTLPAPATTTR